MAYLVFSVLGVFIIDTLVLPSFRSKLYFRTAMTGSVGEPPCQRASPPVELLSGHAHVLMVCKRKKAGPPTHVLVA